MKIKSFLLALAMGTIFVGSNAAQAAVTQRVIQVPRLEQLTMEEKVGQLFFVRAEALQLEQANKNIVDGPVGVIKVTKSLRKGLAKYPVGGVVLFGKNIKKPEQVQKLINDLRQNSTLPLLIAIDEEGGRVARIANNPEMQVINVGDACAVQDATHAYINGHRIGRYLQHYDIDWNFAPVADVLLNKDNKLINKRSFGYDAHKCGELAKAYIAGLHDYEIMSTVKHFPGLGGTESDSHLGLSESNLSLADLEATELVSFQQALAVSEGVMVAHLSLPKVTGGVPASLSKSIITDLLKGRLGYKGLVVTDSLSMGAIVKHYGPVEAPIMALNAGADVLLMPQNLDQAYQGVLQAVKEGRISQERLDDAVEKILQYKLKHKRLRH